MNRGQYTTQPSNSMIYKEYLEIAKLYSRDKSPQLRKYSKSPKPSDPQSQIKRQNEQYRQLQQRYQELQQNYRELFQKAKQRNMEHQKLKAQIKVYKKNHQRDQQQIQRLRCILGLIRKRSVSIQVQQDQLDTSNVGRASRLNKFDQSTQDQIKLKNSGEKIKERLSPNIVNKPKKQEVFDWEKLNKNASQEGLYLKSKAKCNMNNTQKHIAASKYSRQLKNSHARLSNSPYSKLRYVPGTSLK